MSFIINSLFVFALGLIFGSFFNVCIYRLPREESVVRPRSHCPSCQKLIVWYDNIPLLSMVLLRGRCRHCKARISPRYFIVELITGFFYLWIWFYFGFTAQAFVSTVLFSLLLIATAVDLEHQIIPDEVSLGGLAVGIVLSTFLPSLHGQAIWWKGLANSLIGMLVGGGAIYAAGVAGSLIFRKEAMGGGDVKLLAMLGSFMGWEKAVLIFFLAPVLALPLGLFLKFAKRAEVIAFGPFLSLAGWVCFLWGDRIINWYFGRMSW